MKRTIILASTILSLATAAIPAFAQQTPQEQQQEMRRGDRGDRRGPQQGTPPVPQAPAPQPVTPGQMGNPTRTPMPGQGQAYGHQDVNRQYDGRQQQYGGDQRGNDQRGYDRGGSRDARQDYRDGRQDNRQDRRDDFRSYRDYDYNRPDPRYGDYRPERYYRQGNYAPRALGRSDRIYRGGDGRYYCRRDDGTTGLVIGALGGGVLGNVIAPGGSKTLGTVLGGGLGALLGRSIDRGGASCR